MGVRDNELTFSKQQIDELKDKLQKSEVQLQAYSLGLGAQEGIRA